MRLIEPFNAVPDEVLYPISNAVGLGSIVDVSVVTVEPFTDVLALSTLYESAALIVDKALVVVIPHILTPPENTSKALSFVFCKIVLEITFLADKSPSSR